MSRNIEEKPRNPFTLMLLRKLFDAEAHYVFNNEPNRRIKYLAIPREMQQSIEDIRTYKFPKNTESKQYDLAESAVTNVLGRVNRFMYTDKYVNKIAKRITFFGKYYSYDDFEQSFVKWSKDYDDLKGISGKLIEGRRAVVLKATVDDLVFDMMLFLQQCGINKNGELHRYSIQLKERYAIYLQNLEDLESKSIEDIAYHSRMKSYLNEEVSALLHSKVPKFVMVDQWRNIVGYLLLNPINILEDQIKHRTRKEGVRFAFEYVQNEASEIFLVKEITAINRHIFLGLLFHISSLIEMFEQPEDKSNCNICFIAGEKFSVAAALLGLEPMDLFVFEKFINTKKVKSSAEFSYSLRVDKVYTYLIKFKDLHENSIKDPVGVQTY